jgi:hypothetical protein
MFETARLVETVEALREEADSELLALRLLVAAESEVELCAPAEFVAGEPPRALEAEFAGPLLPEFGEAVAPRLAAEADEPKRALEGGVTPARLPALYELPVRPPIAP